MHFFTRPAHTLFFSFFYKARTRPFFYTARTHTFFFFLAHTHPHLPWALTWSPPMWAPPAPAPTLKGIILVRRAKTSQLFFSPLFYTARTRTFFLFLHAPGHPFFYTARTRTFFFFWPPPTLLSFFFCCSLYTPSFLHAPGHPLLVILFTRLWSSFLVVLFTCPLVILFFTRLWSSFFLHAPGHLFTCGPTHTYSG
jgi:hypothetical protein